jgi:glycerol kinase
MAQQTKGNDPISATQEYHSKNFGVVLAKTGLTKREYFAAMAMQGILSNEDNSYETAEDKAETAVKSADALIEALNKEK